MVAKSLVNDDGLAKAIADTVKDLVLLHRVSTFLNGSTLNGDSFSKCIRNFEGQCVKSIASKFDEFIRTRLRDKEDWTDYKELLKSLLLRMPFKPQKIFDRRFIIKLEGPSPDELYLNEKWTPGNIFAAEADELFKGSSRTDTYYLPTNWYVEKVISTILYEKELAEQQEYLKQHLKNPMLSENPSVKGICD